MTFKQIESLVVVLLLTLSLCACQAQNSNGEEGQIVMQSDEQTVSQEILSSPAWQCAVQIEDIFVKPYSGMRLKVFEEKGFTLEEFTYDEIATRDFVSVQKDGADIQVKLSYDQSFPQKYRDCEVLYVRNIRLSENSKVDVWLHDGIKMGESINQLTEKYPGAVYDSEYKCYRYHPLSFEKTVHSQYYGDYDYFMDYTINDNMDIIRYAAENVEALMDSLSQITYEEKDYSSYSASVTASVPSVEGLTAGYTGYIRNYTQGNKAAKISFGNVAAVKIDDTELEKVFQTDTYTVYRAPRYSWSAFYVFKNNESVGICFSLWIVDNEGNVVVPDIHEKDIYGNEVGLLGGQQFVDFNATSSNTSFAYEMAIDIFNHAAQYVVS